MLQNWNSKSDHTQLIVMVGAGEKAFCAGGDIKAICESKSTRFFEKEYELNKLIGTHSKCHVAIIDGFTSK